MILPRDQYHRLEGTPLPDLLPYLRPQDVDIIAVEDKGRIVGTLGLMRTTHLEGLWLADGHGPGAARRLMRDAFEHARMSAGSWVAATPKWSDEVMQSIVRRCGGVKLPLDTYVLSTERRA